MGPGLERAVAQQRQHMHFWRDKRFLIWLIISTVGFIKAWEFIFAAESFRHLTSSRKFSEKIQKTLSPVYQQVSCEFD